jgi:hypothetical protein
MNNFKDMDVIGYGAKSTGGGIDGLDRYDKPKILRYYISHNAFVTGTPSGRVKSEPVKVVINIGDELDKLKKVMTPEIIFALEVLAKANHSLAIVVASLDNKYSDAKAPVVETKR